MKLKINKPKTRPIQIEPWFFRYLNEGQIKVVAAILSHADLKNRQDNSFPSNRVIAFYCGFGLIEKGSKSYEKYITLNEDEKEAFKNKRIKNAIQTVKNIKKSLEEIGLLKKEFVGQRGKQIVYLTLDLEWKKEIYINDYDEFFNNIEQENSTTDENDEINKELEELHRLNEEGNISKNNLTDRLNSLLYKLKANNQANAQVPVEDIEKVAKYIMNTNKMLTKLDKGEIDNKEAYEKSIIRSISNSSFNGVEDYYKGLVKKERADILDTLAASMEYNEPETFYQNKFMLYFKNIEFKNNVYLANYESKDKNIKKQFIIVDEKIKYYLLSPKCYTKPNKEFLENYLYHVIEFQNKFKEVRKEAQNE